MFNKIEFFFNNFYNKKICQNDLINFLNFIKQNLKEFKITKHPLGFIYIELGHFESTIYRFHIWPKNIRYTQIPNWPIHNHIYNLQSIVLSGKLKQIEYEIIIDNEGDNKLFSVDYNSQGTIKKDLKKRIKLIRRNITNLIQYNSYSFQKDLYHSIHVPKNMLSATFVKTSNIDNLKKPIVVSSEMNSNQNIIYLKDPINYKKVLDFIDDIIITI